jgi:hypothetical protein
MAMITTCSLGVAFAPEPVDVDDVVARLIAHWKSPLLPRLGKLSIELARLVILGLGVRVVRGVSVPRAQKDDLVGCAGIQRAQTHAGFVLDPRHDGPELRVRVVTTFSQTSNAEIQTDTPDTATAGQRT